MHGRPVSPGGPRAGRHSAPACPTYRLHRESVFRFWVCMAMLLMRKMGRPAGSSAKGIRNRRESRVFFWKAVEVWQQRLERLRVRTTLSVTGLGQVAGSDGPVDACWRGAPVSFGDIGFSHFQFRSYDPGSTPRLRNRSRCTPYFPFQSPRVEEGEFLPRRNRMLKIQYIRDDKNLDIGDRNHRPLQTATPSP